jgi:hypothetical protein
MPPEDQNIPQNEQPLAVHEMKHGRVGPTLGILILLIVLVLGALFLRGSMLANKEDGAANPQDVGTTETAHDPDVIGADADTMNSNSDATDEDEANEGEFEGSVQGGIEVQ